MLVKDLRLGQEFLIETYDSHEYTLKDLLYKTAIADKVHAKVTGLRVTGKNGYLGTIKTEEQFNEFAEHEVHCIYFICRNKILNGWGTGGREIGVDPSQIFPIPLFERLLNEIFPS